MGSWIMTAAPSRKSRTYLQDRLTLTPAEVGRAARPPLVRVAAPTLRPRRGPFLFGDPRQPNQRPRAGGLWAGGVVTTTRLAYFALSR
jgi:hypothetical protein